LKKMGKDKSVGVTAQEVEASSLAHYHGRPGSCHRIRGALRRHFAGPSEAWIGRSPMQGASPSIKRAFYGCRVITR